MAAVFRLAVCFCSGQADSVDEKHKSVRLLTRQLLRDRPQLQKRLGFVKDLLKL